MGLFDRFKKKSTPEPAEPDASTIVPRIKHVAFIEALQEHGVTQDQMPHTEPFVADLLVTYAFDLPEMFQMVMAHDLRRLGLDPRQLREIAVTNLRREIQEIGRSGEPPLLQAVVGGDLEACVMLLDEFWQTLEGKVPGEIVAAVPSRDVLLITGSESEKGLQLMRESTVEAYAEGGNHSLSSCLFARRNGGWEAIEQVDVSHLQSAGENPAEGQPGLFDQDIPEDVMQKMVKASAMFAVRQEHWDKEANTDRIVEWGYHQDDAILHLKYDDGSNRAFRAQILGSFHPERMEWEWSWNNPHCDAHLSQIASKAKAFGEAHNVRYLTNGMVQVPDTSAVAYLLSLGVGLSDAHATFEADTGEVTVFLAVENELQT